MKIKWEPLVKLRLRKLSTISRVHAASATLNHVKM
jgi:hypothetical protein